MTGEDRERLIRIDENMEHMKASVSILFKQVEGNGQPGLKQRVTKLEASQAGKTQLLASLMAMLAIVLSGLAIYLK